MQMHCFRLQEKGLLQLTEERPTASWLEDGIVRLLDVDYPDVTKELREVLAPLNLEDALLDKMESQAGGVCVETFMHALFLRYPRQAIHDFKDPYITVICVREPSLFFTMECTCLQVKFSRGSTGSEGSEPPPSLTFFSMSCYWGLIVISSGISKLDK